MLFDAIDLNLLATLAGLGLAVTSTVVAYATHNTLRRILRVLCDR